MTAPDHSVPPAADPRRRVRGVRGVRAARLVPPAVIAIAGGVVLLGTGVRGSAQDAMGVDGARATLEQMVETRRIISREQTEWELGRELLQDRIAVVQAEIQTLRERVGRTQESIGEADRARAELQAENARLRESSAQLAAMVGTVEARTVALLTRLPVPIQERVRPLSQRFPEDPETTKLSLSVRFQNVVAVLNEITRFNRELTVTTEKRTVSDGVTTQEVEVAAMYVGIAYGFYTTVDGRYAGIGTATDTSWEWTARNDAAEAIQRAIDILTNEGIADFVSLPITID
jgi:FtsZ-binding cell division protein ZapB